MQDNPSRPHNLPPPHSRREFLERLGGGFGLLALAALQQTAPAATLAANPLAPKPQHFPAKAKRIISLFMHGGASQMESFDPKPALVKLNGQKLPPSLANVQLQFTKASDSLIMAPTVAFSRHGKSGIEVSENWPHVAQIVDDLAIVRSCHHEGFTHSMAMNLMLNGSLRLGFPSVGSWVTYGLGTENQNLPAYIVMLQGGIKAGPPAYGSGFLPAYYQGTVMRNEGSPFLNLERAHGVTDTAQRKLLDELKWFNEQHRHQRDDDSALSARIAAYELAYRMQSESPELADISKEPASVRDMYGIDDPATRDFGLKCLLARRLAERGVRFIQLYSGTSDNNADWDTHTNNDAGQRRMSRSVDKPISALVRDLKQRGMLDETLVVWGGDFGRTPITDLNMQTRQMNGKGRDHNPYGFSMWFAGAGVRGGQVIGATDEIGFKAVEDPVHTHDIHATLLALLGLDHMKLTYFYQGRNFRLTDVHGEHEFSKKLLG
jgi:hypothetical protein